MIVAAMAVAVAVWRFVCAPYTDDFAYAHKCLPTCENDFWEIIGERIVGWRDVLESMVNHWLLVNGRLANLLMILSVAMPQWLVSLCHGAMVGLMIWLVMRCSGAKPMPWMAAVLALVMWKWFPWHDNMMSSDFMFNYPWTCVAMLGYSFLFFNIRKSKPPIAIAVIVAFVAGWMHEGFSIPLCCASAFAILFSPKEIRKRQLPMFAALIVGTALCVFSPSTLMRADRAMGDMMYDYPIFILRLLAGFYPLYIYLIVIGIVAFQNGCRHALAELRRDAFWLIVMVVNMAVAMAVQTSPRALWAADAALLVAVTGLLYRNFVWSRRPHYVATSCMLAVLALFVLELIRWQDRLGEEQQEIIGRLESTKQPVICMNLIQESDLPWWTLGIPRDYVADAGTGYFIAHSLTRCSIGQNLLIVPERFEGKRFDDWDKIPGNNPFRGEYPVVYAADSIPRMRLLLTLGDAKPALSPPARLLQSIMGAADCAAQVENLFRCVTPQGDTIYRYYLMPARGGRHREVTRIDIIE